MFLGVCLYNNYVFAANFIDTASLICYNNNIQYYVVWGDRMSLIGHIAEEVFVCAADTTKGFIADIAKDKIYDLAKKLYHVKKQIPDEASYHTTDKPDTRV